MKVTFDPVKRQVTLEDRGLDSADAEIVFAGSTINLEDTRRDYSERRYQTIGFLDNRMVMIVWTPRDEARHVFSMRKCNDREQAIYRKQLGES